MMEHPSNQSGQPDQPSVVWLASFPKSGNTWVRAILSALDRGSGLFTLSLLGSGGQPYSLRSAFSFLGLDPRWFTRSEAEQLRLALIETPPEVVARKTHEMFRRRPTEWPLSKASADAVPAPFPADKTRAAIHLVRDPRDVVGSYAHHFGLTLEQAVDALGFERRPRADPARLIGEQPWGTWSTHTQSWMQSDLPFPVHRIRYEDLQTDAVGALLPVLNAVGIPTDEANLAEAVARARIDRLQTDEQRQGFREVSPRSDHFFRRGRSGSWREELPAPLVRVIEADHGPVMEQLGYELTTSSSERGRTRVARQASARHRQMRWDRLPDHLGIHVTAGEVPEHLEPAEHPNSFTDVTPDSTLVRLVGGNRILVAGGTHAQVQVPVDVAPGDSGWLVQGWTVAIAMLQRGHLVLHASAVEIGGEAVCIAGRSGAGKSSTALALRSLGYRALVDDVSIIDLDFDDGSGQSPTAGPRVIPYLRGFHLSRTAANGLNIDYDALPELSANRRKATFMPEDPGSEPRPLARIAVVVPDSTVSGIEVEPITGARRLRLLDAHASREGVAPAILGRSRYFDLLTEVAHRVDVVRIRRPRHKWTMSDVTNELLRG